MSGINFSILDLETTGLMSSNSFHEICELSIIRATDRVQLSRKVKVDNPMNASTDALKVIGKTIDDLKKGISKIQLINDVENFLSEDGLTYEHRCLVGHNIINFDRKFLWQQWESYNKTFPMYLYLDTMQMMRSINKKNGIKGGANLIAACDYFGIKKVAGGSHNAKSDSQNTFLLWEKLMQEVDYLDFIKRLPHNSED
jgi:DNA polymerase III epsilon subunit-like protein